MPSTEQKAKWGSKWDAMEEDMQDHIDRAASGSVHIDREASSSFKFGPDVRKSVTPSSKSGTSVTRQRDAAWQSKWDNMENDLQEHVAVAASTPVAGTAHRTEGLPRLPVANLGNFAEGFRSGRTSASGGPGSSGGGSVSTKASSSSSRPSNPVASAEDTTDGATAFCKKTFCRNGIL